MMFIKRAMTNLLTGFSRVKKEADIKRRKPLYEELATSLGTYGALSLYISSENELQNLKDEKDGLSRDLDEYKKQFIDRYTLDTKEKIHSKEESMKENSIELFSKEVLDALTVIVEEEQGLTVADLLRHMKKSIPKHGNYLDEAYQILTKKHKTDDKNLEENLELAMLYNVLRREEDDAKGYFSLKTLPNFPELEKDVRAKDQSIRRIDKEKAEIVTTIAEFEKYAIKDELLLRYLKDKTL